MVLNPALSLARFLLSAAFPHLPPGSRRLEHVDMPTDTRKQEFRREHKAVNSRYRRLRHSERLAKICRRL